jgi:hypothetical protein
MELVEEALASHPAVAAAVAIWEPGYAELVAGRPPELSSASASSFDAVAAASQGASRLTRSR